MEPPAYEAKVMRVRENFQHSPDLLARQVVDNRTRIIELEDELLAVHDDLAGALEGHGGLREAALTIVAAVTRRQPRALDAARKRRSERGG